MHPARVLDLSTGIAGGYCAKLLHDAGARVTKLEPPGGDPLRLRSASGAPVDPVTGSLLFQYLHAGHESAVVDIATPEGHEQALRLASTSDLVLETFDPGEIEALGLGPDAISAVNPAATLVSISAFGRGGPWSNRPATEFTLQAWCGSLEGRGIPGLPPVGIGGRTGDFMAGSAAAFAALAAWRAARASGRGQHVDVSTFEAMLLSYVSYQPIFAQFDEKPYGRSIEIPSIEPAADGWVGFCTITRQQWSDFTVLIERPDLGEDESLAYAGNRMARCDEIRDAIAAWTTKHTVDEIIERALLFRIPVSPVGNGRSVTEMDHLVERGVFVDHPAGFRQPRRPYRLGSLPQPAVEPSPLLRDGLAGTVTVTDLPTRSGAPEAATAPRPFEGMKVVAFVAFWAGPFAGSCLAALGADVIKIESIQRPDGMRFGGGVKLDHPQMYEFSAVTHGATAGLRSLTLDLEREEGRELALRLVAEADVVLDNFSPRVLDNHGLDEVALRRARPDLVIARIPAFGLDGPWRDRGGFAMTVEQASGLAWRTGHTDGQPLVPRGLCDVLGAYHLLIGVLSALEHRDETGEGLLVETPLVETALNVAAEQVIEWTKHGVVLGREGNRSFEWAPQGVYPCTDDDRYVVISVADDEQWWALRALIGMDGLDTLEERRDEHDTIDRAISAWLASQHAEDAVEVLAAAGVPAAPTLDARRLNHLPQLAARGWFEAMDHPVAGRVLYEGLPMRFSAVPRPVYRRPAPTLGQHNHDVLREIGLDDDAVARLEDERVIGTTPVWLLD